MWSIMRLSVSTCSNCKFGTSDILPLSALEGMILVGGCSSLPSSACSSSVFYYTCVKYHLLQGETDFQIIHIWKDVI